MMNPINSINSSDSMNVSNPNLRLIFWELTRRCNLKCAYCRREDYSSCGLALEEALKIIDLISAGYKPIIVFSGGEPLLYRYLFEVAEYARSKNLPTALATNGTLVNENMAKKIKAADFHRVSFSLDGATPSVNDKLRGEGTFLKAIAGLQYLRAEGAELQINTTVTKENFKQIHLIYELALKLGVRALHLFAFVPVGCGVDVPDEKRLCAEEYEVFLNEIAHLALESKIEIKLTCAPHYNRILAEKNSVFISKLSRGCLAGSGVCFISSTGEVYPCGYLALSAGNILRDSFKKIWEESPLFKALRDTSSLKGKCSICEYVSLCGGCRARAYADTGDYLEEEPECVYQPLNVKS